MLISIVIPCYNEAVYIEKCVRSCIDQLPGDFPFETEIFVCDGMSNDGTREVVKKLSEAYIQVKLIDNVKRTTPAALNAGIHAAAGNVILILGAHAALFPDHLSRVLSTLYKYPDAGCVGGIIQSEFSDATSRAIGWAQTSPFGVGNAFFRTGKKSGYVDTVAFGAYRKEVFQQVGYFDEELVRNQDDEFNYRLTRQHIKIFLNPEIRSKYFVRSSFKKLYRQYFQYGFWKVYANKKNGTITTFRQLIPFFFVSFLFLFPLLLFFSVYFLYIWCAVLLLYFFLALYAAASPGTHLSFRSKVLLSFFILHFSYGMGYWKGLLYFIILGKHPPAHAALSR